MDFDLAEDTLPKGIRVNTTYGVSSNPTTISSRRSKHEHSPLTVSNTSYESPRAAPKPHVAPAVESAARRSTSVSSPTGGAFNPETPITLDEFRILMGIPLDTQPKGTRSNSDATTGSTTTVGAETQAPKPAAEAMVRVSWLPKCLLRKRDPEEDSSIYFAIVSEESQARHRYRVCRFLVYVGVLVQLVVSAVLIVLGAMIITMGQLPGRHGKAIATLGAVNGIITGILALVLGQALRNRRNRLTKYLVSLRRMKADIHHMERELRVGKKPISYRAAVALRGEYEACREDEGNWMNGSSSMAED
jgi:hypothetical protein